MTASPLRDRRIGLRLRLTGCRAIHQAEQGGTPLDNVIRTSAWKQRYDRIPLEQRLGTPKPQDDYAVIEIASWFENDK